MTIEADVENGQVVLSSPLALPSGTKITILVDKEPKQQNSGQPIPSLRDRLRISAASAEHLPPDASQDVAHYLYGKPKQ